MAYRKMLVFVYLSFLLCVICKHVISNAVVRRCLVLQTEVVI